MGMFDDVRYTTVCPSCNNNIDGFQSKDGDCVIELLEPNDVDNFYAYCDNCNYSINFTRNETGDEYPRCECCNHIIKPDKWTRTLKKWVNKEYITVDQYTKEIKL